MSQRSIPTSLIRSAGEPSLSSSPEAPARTIEVSAVDVSAVDVSAVDVSAVDVSAVDVSPARCNAVDCGAVILGVAGEEAAALDAALRCLGANATLATSPDEALAQLASGCFTFLLISDATRADLDEVVRRTRLDPRLSRLPIAVLSPGREIDGSLAARCSAHARLGELRTTPAVLLVPRAPAELLESQLGLLVELARTRLRSLGAEEQLSQARRDLRDTIENNAALAEQARRAIGELETARLQLVQAAKLAALGELVAGVAHELNNPLSFSLSHLGTLRRGVSRSLERLGELEPETREESVRLEDRLSGVVLGLDRIKSLVVKLQTFSRLDDGKSQAVNVADAIGTVLTILHHRIHHRIQVTTEFGAPEIVYCQSSLINQCLMNLIVNAIDAIEPLENEGSIYISARAEGEHYVLRVVDNGHGIAPDIHGRIFEPFFTTKPEGKGTGLGLSIAAGVVRKHQGTLELSAADGGGTQAVARLPLERVTVNPRAPSNAL